MVLTPSQTSSRRKSAPVAGSWFGGPAEEALRRSEELHSSLIETMMDGFAYCQMLYDDEGLPIDWVYLAVNSAFVTLTGLDDIVGKRVTEAIPGVREASPELFEIYGRVASGGRPERFEIEFAPLAMWMNIAVSSPAPGYFVAVFEDITDRKRMEAALRLSQLSLDRSGDMIHWIASDGRLVYASESSARRFGLTREELLSLTVFDLDPTMTREAWPAHWQELKVRGSFTFESVHKTRAGEIFPVEVTVNYLEYGGREYNFCFTRDITKRRELEASLRLTQLSVDRAADLIHWVAPDGRLLYVSNSTCVRLGYSREELLGMTIFDLDPVLTGKTWDEQWHRMRELGSFSFESIHRTQAGELFPVEVVVNYVREEGSEYNFVFARDIGRRKKAEQDLHKAKTALEVQNRELREARDALALLARTDSLTGCLNRGAVLSRLDEELERADREGSPLVVGMINVDHFKEINDTYGHAAGDQVLREVVARCLGALRPYDVFGRLGGDEFLVVISAAGEEEARSAFSRIHTAITDKPIVVNAEQIPMKVSIGGVLRSAESATALIGLADEALYEAKALGRNRLVMYGSGPEAGSSSLPPSKRVTEFHSARA